MQFWLWCTFYTNNHPNNSHSAKWCRKMEILCNWKWYSPFNFKLCSYLINLIYTDNPIHIHYVKSWMASRFQKSKGNYIKSYTIFLNMIFIHNPVFSIKYGFEYLFLRWDWPHQGLFPLIVTKSHLDLKWKSGMESTLWPSKKLKKKNVLAG